MIADDLQSSDISILDSAILGFVEGLTEFLPVSSTGHLILSAKWLGLNLDDPGVGAFLIVIQAGALLAVMGLYRKNVLLMARGLIGRSQEGKRLFGLLMVAFLPAVIFGLSFGAAIKEKLFAPIPVAIALGAGGIAILVFERMRTQKNVSFDDSPEESETDFAAMTFRMALIIGLAQCLALWPGTSRSMATILAGMAVGLNPRRAAEFSFLLALPTLFGATVYDVYREGGAIMDASGMAGLATGLTVSCVVAIAAIRYFLHFLMRHGFVVFGYYRIALAAAILIFW